MRYLLPTAVVNYIEQNGLYLDDSTTDKGKGKEKEGTDGAAPSVRTDGW